MHVQIVLDRPHHAGPFTNLDVIAGRIVLRNPSNTNVNAVVVKLEGEARTRLVAAPRAGNERPKPVLEVHKVRGCMGAGSTHLSHTLEELEELERSGEMADVVWVVDSCCTRSSRCSPRRA